MDKSLENKKSIEYSKIIVICAFILNFASNYPQYQISPLAHLIMPELNLNVAQFSSLFSAAMIPGILLGIVSGILCDKYGTKICIGIAGIVSLVGVVTRIFATSYTSLFVCMVTSGIVTSFFNSNVAKIMGNWFPPNKIGTGVGMAMAGATAAMAIAMSTTAMFSSLRIAYTLAAVLSCISIIVWFVFMKDSPKATTHNPEFEMAKTSIKEGLKIVAGNKNIWIIGMCAGLTLASSMCINTFMPQALQINRGFDAVSAGQTSSMVMFGNLVGAILGPVICSKIGKIRPYFLIFSIIAAIGTALAWQAPVGVLLSTCLFIVGIVSSGMISQFVSIPVMLSGIGPTLAGVAGGMVGTIQLVGAVVVPSYIVAPIIGDNFILLFIIAGALVLGAGLLALTLPEVLSKQVK